MTMNTLWFLYTVALFAIALISCSLSLAVWMATRRRDCLVSASGFILYAMELSLIFFDEYARSKYEYPQSFDLPLTHPWESALLSVLFTGALWIWMLMRLHKDLGWRNVGIPIALYAVAAFTLVPKEGMSSTLQQWAYWIVRDLTVIGSLGYALWCYRHTESEAERLDLARSKRFYRLACVLAACIALEDTFMILIYRPPEDVAFVTQFLWHMSERNISENLLMVACAVQLLRKNQQVLSMYFSHPPVGAPAAPAPVDVPRADASADVGDEGGAGASVGASMQDPDDAGSNLGASRYIGIEGAAGDAERLLPAELEVRMRRYNEERGLSPRERDVLRELLQGKDTQNIASALTISPGTVKAHLHRIYRKADVSSRDELLRDFWSS